MAFYEQQLRQFWVAHLRYLAEQRPLFDADQQPKYAPEEHEQRMRSVVEKYEAELARLRREALRDARRISQEEYEADLAREDAWLQSRAALTFADLIIWAREQLKEPKEELREPNDEEY